MSYESPTGASPRERAMTQSRPLVIVVAFSVPDDRVKDHLDLLLSQGVDLRLIAMNAAAWHDFGLDRSVPIHEIHEAEERHPVRWVENALLFRLPRRLIRVVGGERPEGPRKARVTRMRRTHHRLAEGVHNRIYMPAYRVVRPKVLAMVAMRKLRDVPFGQVDRIIVADVNAITLAWHLAKRFPQAVATTNLDVKAYERPAGEPA
ncbi:hypothetical protein GCM10009661_08230 [Catellatospora chokoriensis]|uniref:Uncharacterized protein n=2 Tax=Catellatospora chokoriensis TaxID=310353 RepID=A0A8J3K410_9ACTN|nr:hypothetical protein Cch02nite_25330 [Catellatospora chokoriensis]